MKDFLVFISRIIFNDLRQLMFPSVGRISMRHHSWLTLKFLLAYSLGHVGRCVIFFGHSLIESGAAPPVIIVISWFIPPLTSYTMLYPQYIYIYIHIDPPVIELIRLNSY